MDSNIGKKLDGRYELLELIGVGGMADIYRAKDLEEDRIVAVKILKTELADSDEFLRRFRNESKAIALLSHPNIVKIYDVGFTDKVQFIVMEYVDGITLTDYIEQQGLLKWRDAVHFTIQILRALQHAHDRGIVHRDVKSSNVMLLRDGTIKVMDFGIARFNRENNKTVSEKTIGSVHYISPEQARGDITDERSDIYSVGVALYEMLTGKKPFDGDTPVSIALMHMQTQPKKPSELNGTIPEGLEQIVLRAMQKEPLQRYQTAGEMIKDLEEFKKNPAIIFEYKYNSVDGTAKYVDRAASPALEPERPRRRREPDYEDPDEYEYDDEDDDEDEYEERRSPLIPILFAVGTAFIIATVFLVLMLVSTRLNKTSSDIESIFGIESSSAISLTDSDEFVMPNLIGMTWDEAKSMYGNVINLVAQQEWSTVTKDEIFEQDFVEGRKLKVGATVTVKVSKGIKQIEIQDLTDRTVDAAERQLKKDGFKVSKTYTEDDTVANDRVIRTIPAAHEMAPQGSTVVLVISMGPEDTAMYVPKLTEMPIETALLRCEEYHLIPQVEYVDSEEEKGRVLEQSIEPNTQVDRDTEIILSVSTGEIPEITVSRSITIPKKAEGEFTFEYYIDGILNEEATETRDVGVSAAKTVKFEVTGR
ncbi:MAG: Stk1 family PASTA domain-containing Ser/Thr kinase, partial [Oscillospiraceae bacterium]